ncbi:MAG: glycoside hydrolase family protein [Deltaproteobacteria bacterium]|nr:glycoside hydrolase family protein [Deltaproteobacteria bacterium]
MNEVAVKGWIKKHEVYRDKVYINSQGVSVCGWGHALLEDSVISPEVGQIFFQLDFSQAKRDLKTIFEIYELPNIGPTRKAVLLHMLFNMGLENVRKFDKMLTSLQEEDFEKAADEMLSSKWADQVGARAVEMIGMMRTGMIET